MTALANGKVILFGEHFVVHGAPALAFAIHPGARADIDVPARGEQRPAELCIARWSFSSSATPDAPIARAFDALLAAMQLNARGLRVEADSALPGGAGLGSSGALGVAVARALHAHIYPERTLSSDDLFNYVFAWERVFHGTPSGFDHATSMREGLVVREPHASGNRYRSAALGAPLYFVVAQAEAGASTERMVNGVHAWAAARPERFTELTDNATVLVGSALNAARTGDTTALGTLLDANHALLQEIGVSTPTLDRAVQRAREAGALGAKLTGAGGGGCIVALVPDELTQDRVANALEPSCTHVLRATLEASAERAP